MASVSNMSLIKAAQAIETGLDTAATLSGLKSDAAGPELDLAGRIGQLVGSLLAFVGVVFLILMIWGGFKWMTAHGSPEEVKKAKDLITNAVIGLLIVVGAYLITSFILGRIFEATGVQ